ncbi:hypothetical protein NQZ68_034445, partial [Dissostichus eleginoides]
MSSYGKLYWLCVAAQSGPGGHFEIQWIQMQSEAGFVTGSAQPVLSMLLEAALVAILYGLVLNEPLLISFVFLLASQPAPTTNKYMEGLNPTRTAKEKGFIFLFTLWFSKNLVVNPRGRTFRVEGPQPLLPYAAAMELVVTEEKKKIFRARKTMKISDRQQLETLHSTLLTAAPGMSETASPPLMNGTHKEDGQKAGSKEPSNSSDSGSPQAASPASPSTFLSLNLSPSPSSSQSSKAKDETCSPSTSPFHSLNLELKKIEEEKPKKGSSLSSSKESVPVSSAESKENKEKESEVTPALEKEEDDKTTTKDPAKDLQKDSVEGLAPCLPPPGSNCTEPKDTNTTKAKDTEAPTTKTKVEKPSCPKTTTSDSPNTSPSSSQPASSSNNIKQDKDVKKDDGKKVKVEKEDGKKVKGEKEDGKKVKGEKEDGKNVKGEKEAAKKGSMNEEKMDVDIVKVETKKEKTDVGKTKKTSRPSSTPPSNTVQEEKGSTSGLKRTLSEGSQNDVEAVKYEGKRPKVEREELEAQLEFKFTTEAGSHHKLEKTVQQLVAEQLKGVEQSLYDKHFQELTERVVKIDCATKHQTAINTLQAKINRLTKKCGEANQVSENKRKQE